MANVGFGARLYKAARCPQALVTCAHPASDGTRLGKGDIVKLAGGTYQIGQGPHVPKVIRAASGDACYGVVVGCQQHSVKSGITLGQTYCPASTDMYLDVYPINADDIYCMKEDSVGGSVAESAYTQNINFIVANCDTTTGMSGTMARSSTVAATNTLDLRLLGAVQDPSNTVASNSVLLFQFNKVQTTNQTVGV